MFPWSGIVYVVFPARSVEQVIALKSVYGISCIEVVCTERTFCIRTDVDMDIVLVLTLAFLAFIPSSPSLSLAVAPTVLPALICSFLQLSYSFEALPDVMLCWCGGHFDSWPRHYW